MNNIKKLAESENNFKKAKKELEKDYFSYEKKKNLFTTK